MIEDIENIVICDVLRTPFCHAGQFKSLTPSRLLEKVINTIVSRNSLKTDDIDGVIAGTIMHDSRWSNVARMGSLIAGLDYKSVDYSIQANCNSGFTALLSALGEIVTGGGSLYIASGVEQMSTYGVRVQDNSGLYPNAATFVSGLHEKKDAILEDVDIIDAVTEALTDTDNNVLMAEVAEIMANCFGISREEQDNYTRDNLVKAVEAVESDKLSRYILPVDDIENDSYPLNRKRMLKKENSFSRAKPIYAMGDGSELELFITKHEKHLERLGIKKINPSVTMYNACIPGDGAGACIITTEARAEELGLTPRLRLISWGKIGVDPVIMGIGPASATYKLFQEPQTKRAESVPFDKVDMIEIHEAFAAQVLSTFKYGREKYNMEWDPEKINPYGGSLAFTHPLGATNMRLMADILSRFDEKPSMKYALATGCAGGGLGVSLLFERY